MQNKSEIVTASQEDAKARKKIILIKIGILYKAPLPYRTQEGVTR
jgi:hypothetical protein